MACGTCKKKIAQQQQQQAQEMKTSSPDSKVGELLNSNTEEQLFAMARNLGLSPVSGISAFDLATMIANKLASL